MTRSVDDALLMFEIMRSTHFGEISRHFRAGTGPFAATRESISGLRLAVLESSDRQGIDRDVLDAYDQSIDCFARLGAKIFAKTIPQQWNGYSTDTAKTIMLHEGYQSNRHTIDDGEATVDRWVRQRLTFGRDEITQSDYRAALAKRIDDCARFSEAFADFDGVITPCAPSSAILVSDVDEMNPPANFTRAANYLGLCSLSLPVGFTASELPTGVLINCHRGRDMMAFRLGRAYEAVNEWMDRHPPGLDEQV